ncbi:MAG: class I SAM-dependent methyltransferase [Candidatus Aminicenantes bacterium]|nr:class I SAM-dependent methyltransferase [Candidatus Aminicenantes bacterium]
MRVSRCPLCRNSGDRIPDTEFFLCRECRGFFRDFRRRPGREEERARYEAHQNDVDDPGYQRFVSPIVTAVLRDYGTDHSGLDFGAGPGPVISKLLSDRGFRIVPYDPFFHDRPELLEDTYDYIVCCEVIEHLYSPGEEFLRLKRLLKPGGRLYCMTNLYKQGMDFKSWTYIRDPTHVFIYQAETMDWIKKKYGFSSCDIEDRLITLGNFVPSH